MRRSSEPEERAQFTVAELLARYGEAAPTAGRRHRREAEDPDPVADTAAQSQLNGQAGQEWTPAVGPPSVVVGGVPAPRPLFARQPPRERTVPPEGLPESPVTDRLPRLDPVPVAEEVQDQEFGSPLWEWAVMVSQIGIGVVGGAALWLICEWLWQRIPLVALVVALAVITGLVWVVRRVRRAEDLQTTVIAVLVGLFVTVSPAALLLVGR